MYICLYIIWHLYVYTDTLYAYDFHSFVVYLCNLYIIYIIGVQRHREEHPQEALSGYTISTILYAHYTILYYVLKCI